MRFIRLIAIPCTALALSGCGRSFWDPHLHSSRLLASVELTRDPESVLGPAGAGRALGEVFEAAKEQQRNYLSAVSEQSSLRQVSPLIAAGTAVSGGLLLAGGATASNTITGLLGGAAGLLVFNQYSSNPARQHMYLAGASAIGCVIDNQGPLWARVRSVDRALAAGRRLEAALAAFRTARGNGGAVGAHWPLASDLERLEAAAANALAQVALIPAMVRADFDQAAIHMSTRLVEIVIAVDRELLKTLPEPGVALRLAANFQTTLTAFQAPAIDVLSGPGGQTRTVTTRNALDDTAYALDAALKAVVEALAAVELAPLRSTEPNSCALANLPNLMRMQPLVTTHRFTRVNENWTFLLSGGVAPRLATPVGTAPSTAIAITRTEVGTDTTQFVVTAREAAPNAEARLVLSEASGQPPIEVTLVLPGSTPSAVAPGRDRPGGSGRTESGTNTRSQLTLAEADLMRRWAALPTRQPITPLNPSELSAIGVLVTSRGQRWDGQVTPELLNAVTAGIVASFATLRPTPTEIRAAAAPVASGELAVVARKLCHAWPVASGVRVSSAAELFTPAFREKLFRFQRRQNTPDAPPATGVLDDATFTLLQRPPTPRC